MIFAMFWLRFFPKRRHLPHSWWRLLGSVHQAPQRSIESIVIPCVGEKYVEEGRLSAGFAARNLPEAREIIIASDLSPAAFGGLPPKVRVETLALSPNDIPFGQDYPNIWRSRIVKLRAPGLAQHDVILMIDSDLMLLRAFRTNVIPGVLYGTLYRGKIGHRMKKHLPALPQLRRIPRLWTKHHINGGLLLADRSTWRELSEHWLAHYRTLWRKLPHEMPVDQIPLVMALDELGFRTVDLGPNVNWSVPKKIGNLEAAIPADVIGAHGGFPLTLWEKYRADPQARLTFRGEDYTRKARYQQ